jgi:oxygen-independent coproporphyrinogen-3 oxidase
VGSHWQIDPLTTATIHEVVQERRSLSAYLHIPFCEKKCVYCDFYSIENLSLRGKFVSLLCEEIRLKFQLEPEVIGRKLQTVFFGGGTPSLLEPAELGRIIEALSRYTPLDEDCEFTLECNPGTITLKKLQDYRALGVNRLSFGIQSFDQAELEWLGRIHNADQAREAVRLAREAGFENVSIDLIFALPNQDAATLNRTLDEAIALQTDHISAYNLIVEQGTPLFRLVQLNQVIPLDADRAAELFDLTQTRLSDARFEQYEISNYAKSPEKRAKHNLVYWDGAKDYISFGPSAHEFVEGVRSWNVSSLEQYKKMIELGKLPRLESEVITEDERRTEALYLQLRSTGIDLLRHASDFDEDLLANPEVQALIGDGFLEVVDDRLLALTQIGYRFCDGIVLRLLDRERYTSTFTRKELVEVE